QPPARPALGGTDVRILFLDRAHLNSLVLGIRTRRFRGFVVQVQVRVQGLGERSGLRLRGCGWRPGKTGLGSAPAATFIPERETRARSASPRTWTRTRTWTAKRRKALVPKPRGHFGNGPHPGSDAPFASEVTTRWFDPSVCVIQICRFPLRV